MAAGIFSVLKICPIFILKENCWIEGCTLIMLFSSCKCQIDGLCFVVAFSFMGQFLTPVDI